MTLSLLIVMFAAQLTSGAAVAEEPRTAATAPVEIVLFSDFQCPFCQQFSGPFRELQTKGIDGVQTKVQFKNFPLSIHSNAQIAHQAAMAAREQGKFLEMHDLLFAHQSAVQPNDLPGYAKKLGLDVVRFRKDMDSDRVKECLNTAAPAIMSSRARSGHR